MGLIHWPLLMYAFKPMGCSGNGEFMQWMSIFPPLVVRDFISMILCLALLLVIFSSYKTAYCCPFD